MHDITTFNFYKNTPFTDFQNTLHFKSNLERDNYFDSGVFDQLVFIATFNFVRDRNTLRVPMKTIAYSDLVGVNYCRFISEKENMLYYAKVVNREYLNEYVTELTLVIDGLMTFTQGKILNDLVNIDVTRQHLTKYNFQYYLDEMRNNNDVLTVSTKRYFYEDGLYFSDFYVIIQSSADLTVEFGDEKNPKVQSSKGVSIDRISSPLNIYMVKQGDWNEFSSKLSPFPWIAQNIKSVILMPSLFFSDDNFESVSTKFNFNALNQMVNNSLSNDELLEEELKKISLTMKQLYRLYNITKEDEKILLRNNYATLEVYNFSGQMISIDLGKLDNATGFQLIAQKIIGFENSIAIYPRNYNKIEERQYHKKRIDTEDETSPKEETYGSYLNNAIFFSDFDSVPVLIDNYKLGLAKNSNKRALADSKQLSNRVTNISDSRSSLESRFMDAVSIGTNFSPLNLFGKFTDEYEYYRQQRAEFADMALDLPTVTEQSNSNSFQIRNQNFGITYKLTVPHETEWQHIKKYHKMFGYEYNRYATQLDDVESMTICNYVQFKGSYIIPGVDISIMEVMRIQFENGVRLWHYDESKGSEFPYTNDVLDNSMIGGESIG